MVLHPALVARGTPTDVTFAAVTGFLGSISMSYGIFGWKDSLINIPLRLLFLHRRRHDALPGLPGHAAGGVMVIGAHSSLTK